MNTYEDLVAARKACRLCMVPRPERNPAKMCLLNGEECGADHNVVSHWSQWLGHRRPKLLIVGQDFSNVNYFRDNGGRDAPDSETNENLWRLLTQEAHIKVDRPPDPDPAARVYLTNSILCLKKTPTMTGAPLGSWVDNCAAAHLAPLIQLLQPPIVVAMGGSAWRAVRGFFQLNRAPSRIKAVAGCKWEVDREPERTVVFAVVHCGLKGFLSRDKPSQNKDWHRIGQAFADL